ncbi:MAG TPA: hypothetical protein VLH61_06050 [Bacteroidales bacterium]|nr:hypothetical protein [Bacteroidales bacterium]
MKNVNIKAEFEYIFAVFYNTGKVILFYPNSQVPDLENAFGIKIFIKSFFKLSSQKYANSKNNFLKKANNEGLLSKKTASVIEAVFRENEKQSTDRSDVAEKNRLNQ